MGAKGGADRSSADAADGEAGSAESPDCTKPGRVRRVEWRVGDTGVEGASVKQTGWTRADWARARARERVGRVGRADGGESGRSSQAITAGDFVPIPNGSEHIKEKNLKLPTLLPLGGGFRGRWQVRLLIKDIDSW